MSSAARKGDQHACPQTGHSVNATTTGSPNVFINGVPAARLGDSTSCGAAIMSGSSTVFINGVPAAIMGSATSHGGVIISGSGNVLIGDTYSPQTNATVHQTRDYDEQIQFQTSNPQHMAGLAYYIECTMAPHILALLVMMVCCLEFLHINMVNSQFIGAMTLWRNCKHECCW